MGITGKFAGVLALTAVIMVSHVTGAIAGSPALAALQAQVSALKTQVNTQASQISALQAADSAQAGQISALQVKFTTFSTTAAATIYALNGSISTIMNSNIYALNPYVSVNPDAVYGMKGPNVFFTGANIHIVDGSGSTDDGIFTDPTKMLTGLGNLVIGYNEPRLNIVDGSQILTDRGGSHNLIVGQFHQYSSVGGFVAGIMNKTIGPNSSVSGGAGNTASGSASSVSGGMSNTASAGYSSVSGGMSNTASYSFSSVSGGEYNTASGSASSVSGGMSNTASGVDSSVSGGHGVSEGTDNEWAAGTLQSP